MGLNNRDWRAAEKYNKREAYFREKIEQVSMPWYETMWNTNFEKETLTVVNNKDKESSIEKSKLYKHINSDTYTSEKFISFANLSNEIHVFINYLTAPLLSQFKKKPNKFTIKLNEALKKALIQEYKDYLTSNDTEFTIIYYNKSYKHSTHTIII